MGWTKEVYLLPEDHGWSARPGHEIVVLDAGAVVLEFPEGWFVGPGAGHIEIRDGANLEASTCVLAVSYLRLPDRDWSDLPLSHLLGVAAEGDDRERIATSPRVEAARDGVELAWAELRVVDPGERRESRSRVCIARSRRMQCLITFDFWPEDAERHEPVWGAVLSSLELGVEVADPTLGRRVE